MNKLSLDGRAEEAVSISDALDGSVIVLRETRDEEEGISSSCLTTRKFHSWSNASATSHETYHETKNHRRKANRREGMREMEKRGKKKISHLLDFREESKQALSKIGYQDDSWETRKR